MTVNIYDCTPTTIDNYTGSGTSSGGSSTNIVRRSNKMIVLLDLTSSNNACNLPTDSEVGDTIEFYANSGPSTMWIYAAFGETFLETSTGIDHIDGAGILRKISSTQWGKI